MKKTSIGFAMTGSFCTFERVLKQMEALGAGADMRWCLCCPLTLECWIRAS